MQSTDLPTQESRPGRVASSTDGFAHDFRDPPAAYRGKPFWSWNGQLDRNELLRQVDVLTEMGMGGAFMHSRTGLQIEYLGEEWLNLIRVCAEKCADRGLEAWIYDEDRWPSGTAGGKVTSTDANRMRSLVLRVFEAGEAIEWPLEEDCVEAYLAEISGLSLFSYEALEYESRAHCPDGRSVLIIEREIHPSDSFYNGGAYLDTMSREATEAFLRSTHEKYKQSSADLFGSVIRGIFTDEPHRGFILCDDVQQPGASCPSHSLPYTEGLFEAFQSEFGYALKGRLPELFYRYKGERLSQLKWHYCELLQRLFLRNWAQPCAEWCEKNGLELTGHVLHEDSLVAQAVPVGSLQRYYETMTCPGIDVLSNRCEAFWVAKQVVSTARQLGKRQVLSELYGATGWDMSFEGHKRIGDWQAFQGINLRCQHLSWYSMAGESKRDYPASIFHQSAWYPEYKYVEDYFSRIHLLLEQGAPDCDVLVVHPAESLWAQFHLGWATWLGSNCPDVDQIEKNFATLYHWLVDAQIDFDYGDEEQMNRLGAIVDADGESCFRLGQMHYRTVVVAGMETMRATTLNLLKRFSAAGGSVIFAGPAPTHLDAQSSAEVKNLAERIGRTNWDQTAMIKAIRAVSQQVLLVNQGAPVPGLLSQVRRLEGGAFIVALVNTREEAIPDVSLSLPYGASLEELNCRTGEVQSLFVPAGGRVLEWLADFAPLEERVYCVKIESRAEDILRVETVSSGRIVREYVLAGPFNYSLSEPNAFVMDRPRYRIDEGDWRQPEDILRIDDDLRRMMGWPQRAGTMVQPWCTHKASVEGPTLELEFDFQLDQVPPSLDLLMEQPERWELRLNNQSVPVPDAPGWWIDLALKRFKLPQTQLRTGRNVLLMRTRFRADTDLEAVYLLGEFGVYRQNSGLVIGALPEQLEVGDLVSQGLPFYTGKVSYETSFPDLPGAADVVCALPRFSAACGQISLGEESSIIAFPPYEAQFSRSDALADLRIDLTLTRQNLFGPLHRLPKAESMTGPDSFRTRGTAYSPDYEFFPSGLLEPPLLRYIQR